MKKKVIKKPRYFIVMYPNGAQALIKCDNWKGLIPYSKFVRDEWADETMLIAIRWHEAVKYLLKGKVFDVNK